MKKQKMKIKDNTEYRFTFSVTLTGIGRTAGIAWLDAVEAFQLDPGDPDKVISFEEIK